MITDQQEQLLSYNGKVLIFQLLKEKSSQAGSSKINTLHVRQMTFDTGTKLFVETSAGSFSMSGEGIEMIKSCCASCFRTGILHPYILLKKRKKGGIKYILLLYNFNKFEVVLHFKLDYELKESVKILDGPTVLWSYLKQLFYISPQTGTVLCAPVQFSSIKWVGKIKGEGTVVLGTRSSSLPGGGQSIAKSDALIWGTECFAYALEKQLVLTGATFLPHAYGSIVSCLYICKAETSKNKFRTLIVAVTCKSQLIFFQDGLPKDVQQLPFEKPCSIQMAVVEGDSQLVVVTFASGDICAVWKHNFQVASCWKDVASVLVDDFAGIGTEQILVLLKSGSVSESLNTFQITDFGKVNYMSNISAKEDSSSVKDLQQNCFLTIKALETRLQAGFASVQELQRHLRLKGKVLIESCNALIDMVEDRKHIVPSTVKEGLVSLWDETEKTLENDASTPSAAQEQFVEKVWFRVTEDNLIVAVKLMEAFDLQLSDASLSLIMHQKCPSVSPVRCQSNVVTLKKAMLAEHASYWQLEPCPKRVKLDCYNGNEYNGGPFQAKTDRTKVFTAATQLSPFLAWHQVHCMVLLHAKKKKYKDGNPQENQRLSLICGNILLNLVEISSGKYSINLKETVCSPGQALKNIVVEGFHGRNHWGCCEFSGLYDYVPEAFSPDVLPTSMASTLRGCEVCWKQGSIQDLVALCAVSHNQSFQITSTDCTLNPINTWLREQMECTPVKEFPEYVTCCKFGNLNGTLFRWNQRTPFDGILTVFCRHPAILLHCLHNFIEFLPPTCKIKHLQPGSKKGLAKQLALTLVKEAVTLQHPFPSTLDFTENHMSPNYEENKGTNSIITVQHFKEAFRKEQEQSMLGINQRVSGASYRGHILKVIESQLKSDMISCQCSLLI